MQEGNAKEWTNKDLLETKTDLMKKFRAIFFTFKEYHGHYLEVAFCVHMQYELAILLFDFICRNIFRGKLI